MEHLDVLIVRAGLSGIGAAYHLQTACPQHRYAIVESRDAIGGTWDLFRYPGVRSDSDMFTLGYGFKPWTRAKVIADGPAILDYLQETARENGISQHIRYRHRVKAASWSSARARWTVDVERGDTAEPLQLSCNFLFLCAGYYRYDQGYTPAFEGIDQFNGRVVHPQQWTDDIDYQDKRVLIIGSGATAVTLLPALAAKARHVTMLQRSPSYLVHRSSEDALAKVTRWCLPASWAYGLSRWNNIALGMFVYAMSKSRPDAVRRVLLGGVRRALGPGHDIAKHFTPRYRPWEQRLCLVPDGDMFKAIRQGRASVVTDHIDRFTPSGIRLVSGEHLDADLVVTATGLQLQVLGGLEITVDGQCVDPATTLHYKGVMFSGIPNLASTFGYTNASWTLKSDLISAYVCRLLAHMRSHGYTQATARNTDPDVKPQAWVDFSSGYFQRALHLFPKQGSKSPWKLNQNYIRDIRLLRLGRIDDGILVFGKAS